MESTTLKQQILELREQGLSYNKIVEQLGCAKSTVAYFCNETSRSKSRAHQTKRRKENPLQRKIETFVYRPYTTPKEQVECFTKRYPLRQKIKTFMRDPKTKVMDPVTFSAQDLLELRGTKCYLTGTEINIEDIKTYSLDHLIPRSKGGPNTLDNCYLATKAANFAKGDLSLEEFFELCVKVVKHNNLKID